MLNYSALSSIDAVKCSVLLMSRHSCCCSNIFQLVILSIKLQCNGVHLLVAAKNVSTPARVMPPHMQFILRKRKNLTDEEICLN